MGKKKKKDDEERFFTLDEFDEATLAQFNAGVVKGMYLLDSAYHKELRRLMQSFGDVWASYYQGTITPERQKISDQMSLVVNALETLEDMLAETYETERSGYMIKQSMTEEEFWDLLDTLEEDDEQADTI